MEITFHFLWRKILGFWGSDGVISNLAPNQVFCIHSFRIIEFIIIQSGCSSLFKMAQGTQCIFVDDQLGRDGSLFGLKNQVSSVGSARNRKTRHLRMETKCRAGTYQ